MQDLEYARGTSDPVAERRERRDSVLGQIAMEIERLSATIDDLEQRLHPVLSPFDRVDVLSSVPVPQPSQSLISDHRDSLSAQIGRLQRILDQLEV